MHTTEQFEVDGVKYLPLGGGGAEQDPILPGRTSIKVPANYPTDLYWKNEQPKEEYNEGVLDPGLEFTGRGTEAAGLRRRHQIFSPIALAIAKKPGALAVAKRHGYRCWMKSLTRS